MPNIAQQDYIIIDWEGKYSTDDAKSTEVAALLKNIYLANPLALLSVLFKNYGEDSVTKDSYYPIISVGTDGSKQQVVFYDAFNGEISVFTFPID